MSYPPVNREHLPEPEPLDQVSTEAFWLAEVTARQQQYDGLLDTLSELERDHGTANDDGCYAFYDSADYGRREAISLLIACQDVAVSGLCHQIIYNRFDIEEGQLYYREYSLRHSQRQRLIDSAYGWCYDAPIDNGDHSWLQSCAITVSLAGVCHVRRGPKNIPPRPKAYMPSHHLETEREIASKMDELKHVLTFARAADLQEGIVGALDLPLAK